MAFHFIMGIAWILLDMCTYGIEDKMNNIRLIRHVNDDDDCFLHTRVGDTDWSIFISQSVIV